MSTLAALMLALGFVLIIYAWRVATHAMPGDHEAGYKPLATGAALVLTGLITLCFAISARADIHRAPSATAGVMVLVEEKLLEDAIDLIERQQAEIERLRARCHGTTI